MSSPSPIKEFVLKGISAAPGIEYGPAFVYLQKELEVPLYQIDKKQVQGEVERFKSAIESTKQQLLNIKQEISQRLGVKEGNIFDAHLLVLEDKAIWEETLAYFYTNRCNIAYCFDLVVKKFLEQFKAINDPHLREKYTDIRDISKRVLQNLLGHKSTNLTTLLVEPRIVVSEDFNPSEVVCFSKKRILALVTDSGSCTSHAAIMSRSLDIPSVVGLKEASWRIENGDLILVDGFEGKVVVNPSEETLRRYGQLAENRHFISQVFESVLNDPIVKIEGQDIELWVNLDKQPQPERLKRTGISGVGLFRTESLFLRDERFPTEEEQFQIYKSLAESMHPLPVVIRTVDIGGDKCPKHLDVFQKESNPFLGFRAIRFCLEHPDTFKQQLRAILRATAYGNVRILYPMISSCQEIFKANQFLNECCEELKRGNVPFNPKVSIGAMIEVPSAAFTLDFLAQHCDFFSVGTNDLIQYLVAVDRGNERIAHLYEPTHPAVLRVLRHLVEQSERLKKPLHLCGEIASDTILLPLLVGIGMRSFSIHLDKLAEIKYLLKKISLKEVDGLVQKALLSNEGKETFLMFRDFYLKKLNEIN